MNLFKKKLSLFLVLVMTMSCMCIHVFAASGTDAGICDVKTFVDGVIVSPETAAGVAATKNADGVYVNAERAKITFSGAIASKYYLVVALDGGAQYPTVDDDDGNNVAYMNQVRADGSLVSFDVYPKELVSGQTYTIYISSNDGVNGYHKVASFAYYTPYKLGDVDENNKVQSVDALRVLRAVAQQITLTSSQAVAADVNRDGKVQSVDALRILRYVAQQITEF